MVELAGSNAAPEFYLSFKLFRFPIRQVENHLYEGERRRGMRTISVATHVTVDRAFDSGIADD
jgi:hypothetical protein